MDWINIKDAIPNPKSHDMYWITDGEIVGWCFFGCDDEGSEHWNFMGGDCSGSLYENATHWIKIILPNKKKENPNKKIKANRGL